MHGFKPMPGAVDGQFNLTHELVVGQDEPSRCHALFSLQSLIQRDAACGADRQRCGAVETADPQADGHPRCRRRSYPAHRGPGSEDPAVWRGLRKREHPGGPIVRGKPAQQPGPLLSQSFCRKRVVRLEISGRRQLAEER